MTPPDTITTAHLKTSQQTIQSSHAYQTLLTLECAQGWTKPSHTMARLTTIAAQAQCSIDLVIFTFLSDLANYRTALSAHPKEEPAM
jgi:hypothetical protein